MSWILVVLSKRNRESHLFHLPRISGKSPDSFEISSFSLTLYYFSGCNRILGCTSELEGFAALLLFQWCLATLFPLNGISLSLSQYCFVSNTLKSWEGVPWCVCFAFRLLGTFSLEAHGLGLGNCSSTTYLMDASPLLFSLFLSF